MKLEGKVAVVTGSATGIGRGIALALYKEGAKVIVTYNRSPADKTMEAIEAAGPGGEAFAASVNVQDRESIRALFSTAAEKFGGVDILVNNAAIQPNLWLLEYPEDEYDAVIRTNLMGYWRCIQEALPYLKKSKCGRVINVASIHAKRPTGFDAIYGMSKGGIRMLTREAAVALAPYRITVNALNFGAVRVEGKSGSHPFKPGKVLPSKFERGAEFLSGRVGVPADGGYLAVFLACEESQFINGSSIRADGGVMLVAP
ncbi:MAG: SDR family oxidoreductase [Clostridiales bacterium]|jgi:glucose 1-dehydrogenase|nr:SDR family oxidoreductase [Clostridiales bacterium]